MKEPVYNKCFACGKENPIGLKMTFEYSENQAVSYYTISSNYQGYDSVTHGGIVSTLLDEAMGKIILYNGIVSVTGELNIRFRKPLPVDKEVKVIGEIVMVKSKTIKTHGRIEFDGEICAEAQATFVKIRPKHEKFS